MAVVRYTVANGEIIAEKRGGVRRSYVPDPLGSTVALLDNTQTKTDTFSYWPYGEVQSRTGTTATPFQFVGTLGYYRDATDRMYVRARFLRPNLGRWQTVDPIWPDDDDFGYCEMNPTSDWDWSGMQSNKKTGKQGKKKPKQKPKGPLEIRPIDYPKGPNVQDWRDCLSAAIKKHCSDILTKYPGSNSRLYAYAWCIIEGESSWVPGCSTPFTYGGESGKAVGFFQLIESHEGGFCRSLGYEHWDTDPCENIACGVAVMCQCIRNKGDIMKCGPKPWNYISYKQSRFKACLKKVFGIADE